MKIVSSIAPFSKSGSVFGKSNVNFTGIKNRENAAGSKNSGNTENSTPLMKNKTLDEVISQLREQIEKVKANDSYDDKVKKYKVESLLSRIEELEEMDRAQKAMEAAKALEGNKDEALEKAKEKKKEFEKNNKDTSEVEIGFSVEGFKSLVSAELEIGKAIEHRTFKAKKNLELARAEIDAKNDKALGQSMQNNIKAADSIFEIKRVSESAMDEFVENNGDINKFLEGVDRKDTALFMEHVNAYTKAMNGFVKSAVEEFLNSPDFKNRYIYLNEDKEGLTGELENVVESIDKLIAESLRKANKAAENAGEETSEGSSETGDYTGENIGAAIFNAVSKRVMRDIDLKEQ